MSTPHVILWDPGNFVGGSVQFGSDLGPFEFGGNLYCVTASYDVMTLDATLQIFKSVDSGVTWAEQDSANAPTGGLDYVFDGTDTFYLVHDDGASKLVVKTFDCNTDTFGADSVSGPTFTVSGHPAITVEVQVLSTGTVVCGYRPTGGGFNIVELVAGVWGTPAVVSATSFELIMGGVLCPGDVVYFLIQQFFPFNPRTVSSYQWASGAIVGSPVHITDMDTSFDEWTLNGDDTTMSFPGLYSSSLNAMIFALYNYSDPSDFKLTLLVGTLGSPVTWSVIPGPTAPNMASSGNVSPRLALNADESILYMSLNQLADTGIDGTIWLWSSTDGGNTWSDPPTAIYDYEINPPSPPPTTIDAIESPTLHVLASGDIGIIMGLSTSPTFIFCGVNYYLTEPIAPPETQTLELTKIVSGGTASPADFLLSAVGGSPETEISGAGHVGPTEVSPGVYELSETSTSSPSWGDATWGVDLWGGDYSPQPWDCGDADMPTPTSVVVPEGGTVACSITNVFVPTPPPPGPGNGQANPVGCFELLRVDVTLMPSRHLPTRGSVR
jgi:hypothetical protein